MKSPEAIARALRESRKPAPAFDPAEIRLAVARSWRKSSHGGRPMPDAVVRGMYDVYQRTGSLDKTGRVFCRDATTMAFIFKSHGLVMKGRGGPNHRHDRATILRWYEAYRAFGTAREVGRMFGKSPHTVIKAFHSHGLQVRPRGGRMHYGTRATPAAVRAA